MAQQCNNEDRRLTPCEIDRLARRQDLERMPMCRLSGEEDPGDACATPCLGELLTLVEAQNRILCDLLGAVSALTASQLAVRSAREARA